MSSAAKLEVVRNAVDEQVVSILQSDSYGIWQEDNPLRSGDLVAFNNSFLYREGISGTKSVKYLCVRVDRDGVPATPVMVIEPGGINLRFKRIPARQANELPLTGLSEAAEFELKNLGLIIRALIGRIGDDEPAFVGIDKAPGWHTLRYNPKQSEIVKIQSGELSINRIDDINAVWLAISQAVSAGKLDDVEKLAAVFEGKFVELRESAYRPVDIDKVNHAESSILGEVTQRIDYQITEYSVALRSHLKKAGDTESLNELLRIAYNFADGTQELMRLIIGVSDMKPVLSWLTIAAQLRLADRFQSLPFGIIGTAKPSIGKYRAIVAGARNRAFHDIFSFGQPFRVRLTSEAFRAPELRLFRQYASKAPALDYEDRRLVALLEGFTRTSEQTVPLGFWESNLGVMKAVADVTHSLQKALIMLTAGRR